MATARRPRVVVGGGREGGREWEMSDEVALRVCGGYVRRWGHGRHGRLCIPIALP